ncbi:putative piggyBac transposable element-derived protein 4-like [Triplophysa rosa]|uniref:PiggyBac transposable element-derived protein 4-like n=1 Tax=Triplophysa rosa TaxID=992332 RepID=A0A9W8C0Z3_TRIRA|nr:putative piggyBac transposable element-derived protein 4-like [Triplophysa rosa]
MEKLILDMTNLEGTRVFGESWKILDEIHLKAYIGLLILAGVFKSNGESTSSLWNAETGRAIFPATMSCNNNSELDKLAPIRELWDKWVERLPLLYNSGLNVTVDERLVPFRGRCPFRQYMQSKPAKYGIKICAACDAQSSYAWNMQVYMGLRVVLDMTTGLRGHKIVCDHFFTSYLLGEELLKRKLTMLGTIRKNKPELPKELLNMKNRKVTSSIFAFTDTTTLVSYCPKKSKNVLLMSTLHKYATLSSSEDRKPQIILDYNATKGGVDNLDKVTATYSCQRMTACWPLVIFHNIIDASAYNAFLDGKLNRRRIFLEQLGQALIQATQPRPAVASTPQGQKRSRCQVCTHRNDCKTSTRCEKCNLFICKEHAYTICT